MKLPILDEKLVMDHWTKKGSIVGKKCRKCSPFWSFKYIYGMITVLLRYHTFTVFNHAIFQFVAFELRKNVGFIAIY